jgi:hypothetical protein
LSILCFSTSKTLILTIHGNLGRYSCLKNIIDYISIALCNVPIVINEASFNKARALNSNALFMSAFLPPLGVNELDDELVSKINIIKRSYGVVFCTNAYNMSMDKDGVEIYGVLELIDLFSEHKENAIIISDPSAAYWSHCCLASKDIPDNVLLISSAHDFYEILKLSDVFIRNTSTDGDSLSIKEALSLGKMVFATDVVNRPHGCVLYKRGNSAKILEIDSSCMGDPIGNKINYSCFEELVSLYSEFR